MVPIIVAGILCGPALTADAQTTASPKIETFKAKKSKYKDVFSSDGQKVGDVIDYVLQFQKTPQLRFVVIKTGGLIGAGGYTRAIPADAFTRKGDRFYVSLSKEAYDDLPVMMENHRKWLAKPGNTEKMARLCNTPNKNSELSGEFVTLNGLLDTHSVVGSGGRELGVVDELWINFNANQAPYLQIMPTDEDLLRPRWGSALRYNIPTSKFARLRGRVAYLSVSAKDINKAQMVEDGATHVAKEGDELRTFQSKTKDLDYLDLEDDD